MKNSPICQDTAIQITAYYALSLPEYHMPMHAHPSCEIMYVTSGGCTVYCGDERLPLGANQFIFLPGGLPHRLEIEAGHPCAILNLEFRRQEGPGAIPLAELASRRQEAAGRIPPAEPASRLPETAGIPLAELSSRRPEAAGIPLAELASRCPEAAELLWSTDSFLLADDLRNLGYAMKDLISQLQQEKEDSAYLLQLLFYRTMLELAYCARHDRQTAGLLYLKKACSYIEQNLLEPLSVPDIAAHAGVNKSYLQLFFSQFLGCPVGKYITQKRMEQAAFLLTNSSLGITDVAFSSGYNSRQHFAHTFACCYHMSPSAYRKLHARTLVPDTEGAQLLLDADGQTRRLAMNHGNSG